MLQSLDLLKILFIDIETVPQAAAFDELSLESAQLWTHKSQFIRTEMAQSPEELYHRAGIYAEFGKIICISTGYLTFENNQYEMHLKSFSGIDEKLLLMDFKEMMNKISNRWYLCAHNGREFDFPYISRRMIIHEIALPGIFDIRNKWKNEIRLLDTLELWKFGDYKHYTSLELLAHVLQIPSPKSDLNGSMIYDTFYKEKDLDRIVRYCENDVKTLAKVFARLQGNKIQL